MCVIVVAAIAAVAAVAADVSANKQAKKTEKALKKQAETRADQLASQASQEMNQRASQIRAARASARANASGAGINLGSGSFLAQLESYDQALDEAQGLQAKNLDNSIAANADSLNVSLSQLQFKTGLGMALDGFTAGAQAYMSGGGSMASKPAGK